MWINALVGSVAIVFIVLASSAKFNDLVFFKKSPGIRIDFNKAIDQLQLDKIKIPSPTANPIFGQMQQRLLSLEDKTNVLKVAVTSDNSSLWLVCICVFLGCSLIFTVYKYNSLSKKFTSLINITNRLLAKEKKTLESIRNWKVSSVEFANQQTRSLHLLREQTIKLKNAFHWDLAANKTAVDAFMDKYKKALLGMSNHYLKKNLSSLRDTLKAQEKATVLAALSNLHNKFIKSRTFDNYKNTPACLIYAGLSLVIVYTLLESGFHSDFAEEFVTTVNSQTYFSYGDYSTIFHIKDLEHNFNTGVVSFDKKMDIKVTTTNTEKLFEKFAKRSKTNALGLLK